MLASTFEMVSDATSNSLLIFCICNVIIACLLFLGSSKSMSVALDDNNHSTKVAPRKIERVEFKENQTWKSSGGEFMVTKVVSRMTEEVGFKENQQWKRSGGGEIVDTGDDELRARVEEFIEKMNKAWKEEEMRGAYMGFVKHGSARVY